MTNGRGALGGRRVVIVGGTSGMGRGAARAACDAGAEVIVAGRRPPSERVNAGSARHENVDIAHGARQDDAQGRVSDSELVGDELGRVLDGG